MATFNAVTLPENAGFGFVQLGQPVKIKIYVDPNTQIVVTATLRTGPFFLLAPVSDRSCRDALQRHTQRPTDLGLTRHSSRADHGRLDLTALCPDGQS